MKRCYRHKLRRFLAVVCLFSLAISALFAWQFRPLILDGACKAVRNIAQEAISEAVCELLENEPTDYTQLIRISYNAGGAVTALQANAAKINRIKARAVTLVRERLSETDVCRIGVPLGTLCGVTLLSGYGPSVPCSFLVSSVPSAGMEYHFDGAGVNQTLHSIILVLHVPLSVTLPLQSADVEVNASFLIGETILVGEVPDSYTNVISDPEVADDIFNYGDAG